MTTEELFRHRLIFTVGKGGVGRTTVTLALALEAARRGRSVLCVELEGALGLISGLEEQRSAKSPPAGIERIASLTVEGKRALEEYLTMIIPVRRLRKTIFGSKIYQYFVAAAPGLKELMTIGKIWFEAERRCEADPARPHWDVVLVDGPATGHSLQVLRMPQAAHETFPSGLVHREAERIVSVLRDPEATAVIVVTTAEEMPVNETAEIDAGLRTLGLSTSLLVVNEVHSTPCKPAELEALKYGISHARTSAKRDDLQLFREVVARAADECGWASINAINITRLMAQVSAPIVKLPFLFAEEFGPADVQHLSTELAARVDAGETVTAAPTATRSRRGRA